jgi:multidrug efflux pump subunit AcrA (membrane-fusion protein)
MSAGISALGWGLIAATVASAGVSYYNGQQQAKGQKAALDQAKASAQAQAKQAEMDANRANMAMPDTAAMMSEAMLSGRSGQSGTLLTGPSGINLDTLKLSRNTLLGG